MILQELNRYYERKLSEDDTDMPPQGTSVEGVSFALVLGNDGSLVGIDDLRDQEGNKMLARKIPVPAAVTRTSGIKANFLWDKTSYVIGADNDGGEEVHRPRFQAFKNLFQEVSDNIDDAGLMAIRRFLASWDISKSETHISLFHPWAEVASTNLVFRLDGIRGFIHNRPLAQQAWQ